MISIINIRGKLSVIHDISGSNPTDIILFPSRARKLITIRKVCSIGFTFPNTEFSYRHYLLTDQNG